MPEQNEYSREAYDEAEKNIAEAKSRINPEASTDELKDAIEARAQGEERRGKLHEMAWDEALELNRQYDELYAKKEQVDQEIADFRREKLGMGEEKAIEAEKKEPTLEEWATVYAEMQDIDEAQVLEALQAFQTELSEDERKELTLPIFGKEGLSPASAWKIVAKENPTYKYIDPEKITTEGETDKAFVGFARFSQEADEDSLGDKAKSAEDWEKTGDKFMSSKVAMLAREAFRRLTGKQMDERNWTMCPGSRSGGGYVPYLCFDSYGGWVDLDGSFPGDRDPFLGVRRVVSKELES